MADKPNTEKALKQLQRRRDSLKKDLISRNLEESKTFNPNYLDEYKAYHLGLSYEHMKRLNAFRKEGGYLRSAGKFREVTGINDSLFRSILHLLNFPAGPERKHATEDSVKKSRPLEKKGDLNKVTEEELQGIKGVGKILSKRIIAYRKYLGGYSYNGQLHEVYNLPEPAVLRILSAYEVARKPEIQRLDLNTATFNQLLKLPYIDYALTKKIVQFREEKGFVQNLEELMQIDSFPIEKFERIALYLLAE